MVIDSFRRALKDVFRRTWFAGVPQLRPRIIRRIPHDPGAFTQGLLLRKGRLFESTGRPNRSQLRELDLVSGQLLRAVDVPDVWAEGLALRGDRLIQLTWTHEVAYEYDVGTLTRVGQTVYSGEGWGLDSVGDGFVMTDGSHRIAFRDGEFQVRSVVEVRLKGWPVRFLNDLVCVRGHLYVNRWRSSDILEIDPGSGAVTGRVDCTDLVREAAPIDPEHVLNGIAFDETTDTFLVTGKCWPLIFVVRFEGFDGEGLSK